MTYLQGNAVLLGHLYILAMVPVWQNLNCLKKICYIETNLRKISREYKKEKLCVHDLCTFYNFRF
jgi:hypothetical protein